MSHTIVRTKQITCSALFAAIATVVMFFAFPLPFIPPFLKIDLSGTISILAAFMFGPLPAIFITGVKDIIHAFSTTTGGVGELADFLMISAFCLTASGIYRRMHTKKGAVLALSGGILVMTIVGCFINKYMLIPFFSQIMPIETILKLCTSINPLIGSINTYILFGVVPFNMVKGLILSILTMLLYKHLSSFMKENTICNKKTVSIDKSI